jgi:uncharacterized protein involved in exopolysaccharide biosynthesis
MHRNPSLMVCTSAADVLNPIIDELKKQYELAKIEEIKNIPIINVLDAARPPVRRSYPIRSRTALVSFFLSLAFGVGFAAFKVRGTEALKKLTLALKNHRPMQMPVVQGENAK